MKLDLDLMLLDPFGKPFTDNATVKAAAYAALVSPMPDDQMLGMEQKLSLYRLAQKIAAGGIVDLTADEIATIQQRGSKTLPLVAFGALWNALETRAQVVPLDREAAAR